MQSRGKMSGGDAVNAVASGNQLSMPVWKERYKAVKHYEKMKDKGENVYIDTLTYDEFMMLVDTELSRRFSLQDEAEQKEEVKKALAAGVAKSTILTYFYPEVTVERMSLYRKK